MLEIEEMTAREFITFRLNVIEEETVDLILEMERVAHSPSELSFLSGRITELNYEKINLKKYIENEESY